MSPSKLYTPHDVVADINYFSSDQKVRQHGSFEQRYVNKKYEGTRTMKIRDVRSIEDQFDLDRNGFKFVKIATKERNTKDEEEILNQYYKEMEVEIKNLTGASKVVVFNHVIRQVEASINEGNTDMRDPNTNGPAGHPHVDYCGVPELVEGVRKTVPLPEGMSGLYDTAKRFCFVGTWRPIKTLTRDPLAVCDATTVPDSDYLLKVRKYPNGHDGGNHIMAHESREDMHQWYYMHEMQPDEMIIFKGYDTEQSQPGWRCPHTAFVLPGSENEPVRESIETRAVCFWE